MSQPNVGSELTQFEKATLPVFATPRDAIEDHLDIQMLRDAIDNEEHEDRIESAIDGTFYVFPRTAGMYEVQSVKDGIVENTYRVSLQRRSSCSCYDHILRCTSSGMYCKHVWRTRFLIKLGALPQKDEDPFSWLINELHKDRTWIRSRNDNVESAVEEIERIESEMTLAGRTDADYQSIMRERAHALMPVV